MNRAHTVAAVAVIALIPLVPFVLWVYAAAASVDRGSTVARNEHVFRALPALPGAKLVAAYSYPVHRWDVGESMTPVDRYRTEFFLRLPRKIPKHEIFAHYRRVLVGWSERRSFAGVDFRRGRLAVEVDVFETSRPAARVKAYSVYVSQ